MKIAVSGINFSPDFSKYVVEFFSILKSHNIDVVVYKPFYDFLITKSHHDPKVSSLFETKDQIPDDIDFLISIGGDGSFLSSLRFLKSFEIPVIGLNSGRLGFLANISKEEISEALEAIIEGNYNLEKRSLISLESESPRALDSHSFALNDITVQKKGTVMITIDAFLDNEYLNTYWTDGLIISTPTGSTAYSLSVGGPIVLPGSSNFVIAPIASHNLTVRPIVIPNNMEIRLVVQSREDNFLITTDNHTAIMDIKHNTLVLRKAIYELRMLKLPFNNYYSTIRNKLMWGADKRN